MTSDRVLVNSKTMPIKGLRSSIPKYLCSDGEYPMISELRWMLGDFYGRGGTSQYMDVPTSGAVPVDFWEGELNGTYYKVGAFNVSGAIRVYYATGTSWTEITGTTTYSGSSGSTRFATQSGRVSFAAVKAPAEYVLSVVPDRDVLIIQNGEDYPRIWDPGQSEALLRCLVHQEITIPEHAEEFRQVATFEKFWQVAASSGKTYASGGVVNQTRFRLLDSTAAPYTGTNACPVWEATTSAAENDIATIQFNASLVPQAQVVWVVEGTIANIKALLAQAKIEISKDNVAYGSISNLQTLYDSAGTSQHNKYEIVNIDVASNRYLIYFPSTHIAVAERTAYHLKITRKAGAVPTGSQSMTIVAICSGSTFPGNCEWTMAYADGYSRAESPGFVASRLLGAEVGQIGGPQVSGFSLPLDEGVRYDFDLIVRNTATNATPFTGGLNGLPDRVNFYLRLNGEEKAYFMYSGLLYDPGLVGGTTPGWTQHTGSFLGTEAVYNTNEITYTYERDAKDRNFDRPAPTDFQIAVPVAREVLAANGRLFAAHVKSNGEYQRGDIYISALSMPFRLEAAQLTSFSGTHVQINGETIQRLSSVAASAQGMSYIFVHTDKAFWSLGGAGAFGASDASVDSLSVPRRIAYAGTRSPRSVAGRNGLLAWLDQDFVFRVYSGDKPQDVSTFAIENLFAAVPSALRAQVCTHIIKDRIYVGMAAAGASTNNRVAVFNLQLGAWESFDTPPSPCTAERIISAYVPGDNGSGNRILLAGSDGKMYNFDGSDTTDLGNDISFTLTFPEFEADKFQLTLQDFYVMATAINKTWTLNRHYRHPVSSQYRTTFNMSNGIVTDSKAHTEISAPSDNKGERGAFAYCSLSGAITNAHHIEKAWIGVVSGNSSEYKQG